MQFAKLSWEFWTTSLVSLSLIFTSTRAAFWQPFQQKHQPERSNAE